MSEHYETFVSVAIDYLSQRSVSRHYSENVTRIATRAGAISTERVNAFLKGRLEQVSTVTAKAERVVLLSLWRAAYEAGKVNDPPRGVLRIKAKRPPTRAWTVEEMRRAIAKTDEVRGRTLRNGADLGAFLKCWLLLGYESGARRGDIFSFTGQHLDGDVLRWTMAKTGDPMTKHLSPACLRACREMLEQSPDGSILAWVVQRRRAAILLKEHLDRCGMAGSSKFLRRSGATHIEIESPGLATRHLGHRTAALASQAYLDWGQIRKCSPQTPVLVAS